jgi:hypothetical protein
MLLMIAIRGMVASLGTALNSTQGCYRGRTDWLEPSANSLSNLIDWSVQEIRRVATRLAQRRIQPADIIAWSLWRRAHQAAAKRSHLKQKMQL